MHVEIAEERILLLPDAIGAEQARTLAWAKRSEAFGAFARIGGRCALVEFTRIFTGRSPEEFP